MKLYSVVPHILQFIAGWFSHFLFRIFYGLEIRGVENLKNFKQAIFACNHASELDAILLTDAVIGLGHFSPMFYVSGDKSFFKADHFGWRKHIYGELFFACWGAFTAYSGLKDYEKSLVNHVEILEDGYSLCIFPEGRMTRDGNLQEGHGGVVFLSQRTGVPIVPVRIRGTYKFSFTPSFLSKRKIEVVFGEPFLPVFEKGFSVEEAKVRAQEVMAKIAAL